MGRDTGAPFPEPTWSEWRRFPDPQRLDCLHAPFGPGVYELRRAASRELVLAGCGKNCAHRMTSLLPSPIGQGTRDNADKRNYVLEHLADIEYRTCACVSKKAALEEERRLRKTNNYRFKT
jgi:hypothetical protein